MTLPLVVLPLPAPPGIANIKAVINGFLFCNGPTVRTRASLRMQIVYTLLNPYMYIDRNHGLDHACVICFGP